MEFKFVRWGPNHNYAVFKEVTTGRLVYVPFSRLIPTPACEAYYMVRVGDPNVIAVLCAEESSIFGPAIARHFNHLLLKYGRTDVREPEKEYRFPLSIDFSCVRDCILMGGDTDRCIRKCS